MTVKGVHAVESTKEQVFKILLHTCRGLKKISYRAYNVVEGLGHVIWDGLGSGHKI